MLINLIKILKTIISHIEEDTKIKEEIIEIIEIINLIKTKDIDHEVIVEAEVITRNIKIEIDKKKKRERIDLVLNNTKDTKVVEDINNKAHLLLEDQLNSVIKVFKVNQVEFNLQVLQITDMIMWFSC